MPERIPLGGSIRVALKAFLSSDHLSPATGKTIDIEISKNGAAFDDPDAGPTTATEIELGWYYVDLDGAADIDTLGPLLVRGTEASIDDAEERYHVVPSASDVNVTAIDSSTDAAARLKHGASCLGFGTVDTAASSTSVPTSALDPAAGVADQFKNAVIVFKADTTTANLRGVRARVTASSSGGTLTVSPALPATPVSGDIFTLE